jgi:hypothetical protein
MFYFEENYEKLFHMTAKNSKLRIIYIYENVLFHFEKNWRIGWKTASKLIE